VSILPCWRPKWDRKYSAAILPAPLHRLVRKLAGLLNDTAHLDQADPPSVVDLVDVAKQEAEWGAYHGQG